jgi:hypothetical protein
LNPVKNTASIGELAKIVEKQLKVKDSKKEYIDSHLNTKICRLRTNILNLEAKFKAKNTTQDELSKISADLKPLYLRHNTLKTKKEYEQIVRDTFLAEISPQSFEKSIFCKNYHLLSMIRY